MQKILIVIPARGGSKGIKCKNLRLLNNKPLIYYQIQNALNLNLNKDIIVTSDNQDILDYAINFPLEIRKRPKKLATDEITLDPVVFDATKFMENKKNKRYDLVLTLQTTSPLLKPETLNRALKVFVEKASDTLIPVIDVTHLYWKETNGKIIPDYGERLNRQWLEKRYKEAGAFLITQRNFLTVKSRFGHKIDVFMMDEIEGLDIDTEIDFIIAESMIKRLKFVFVCDGNENIGMGHIYRTLTIADAFLGNEIVFLTSKSNEEAISLIMERGYETVLIEPNLLITKIAEIGADIVINDVLDTDELYVNQLKDMGLFVVNFEDLGTGSNNAHLVFNALYERTNAKPNHLYGYEYECLNEKFFLYPPIEYKKKSKNLLVTFGGIDQNNLTLRTIKLASRIFEETEIEKIIVVVGGGYPHFSALKETIDEIKLPIELHQRVNNMPFLMSKVDLAITSNGRTIYELAAMGIPTISIAQNDRETLHLFARYSEGVKYLGISCTITDDIILNSIKDITNNSVKIEKMYKSQLKATKTLRKGLRKIKDEITSNYWKWKHD